MAKVPDSSKSESWTVRVPNDLADLARDKAISLGMLKLGGKPNTTLIIHAALRTWLELPNDISNTVSSNASNDISNGVIQVLESRLDDLTNVISNTVKHDELALFKDEILELVNSVLEPLKSEFNLETIKSEILQNVELMIAASMNTQAVVNTIAAPETKHNQLDLTDIPPVSQAIDISPEIADSDHPYPVGANLYLEGLGQHLGFHYRMYTKYASDLGQTPDEYIDSFANTKGEQWERGKEGKKAVFTRIK